MKAAVGAAVEEENELVWLGGQLEDLCHLLVVSGRGGGGGGGGGGEWRWGW